MNHNPLFLFNVNWKIFEPLNVIGSEVFLKIVKFCSFYFIPSDFFHFLFVNFCDFFLASHSKKFMIPLYGKSIWATSNPFYHFSGFWSFINNISHKIECVFWGEFYFFDKEHELVKAAMYISDKIGFRSFSCCVIYYKTIHNIYKKEIKVSHSSLESASARIFDLCPSIIKTSSIVSLS